MAQGPRQFDPEVGPAGPNERLGQDLRRVYGCPRPVPGAVDRAILDQARARLKGTSRRRVIRIRPWMAGVAAAVVIGFGLWAMLRPVSGQVRGDVNGDGTVNILDAFSLARCIHADQVPQQVWDLNQDGTIDQKDVDLVALVAVRLDRREVL